MEEVWLIKKILSILVNSTENGNFAYMVSGDAVAYLSTLAASHGYDNEWESRYELINKFLVEVISANKEIFSFYSTIAYSKANKVYYRDKLITYSA